MLKIEIETTGAAFHPTDDAAELDSTEVARILRNIAERIETGYRDGFPLDVNGNSVGRWTLTDA